MTSEQLLRLHASLIAHFRAGSCTDEIELWADAYYFGRRDLIDLLRLLFERGDLGATDLGDQA